MALKLTQNSTGKTWSSGSKKEEKKEERQKTTGASAPVEEKYSSPSGKLTLTRTSTSTSTPADDPNLLERIGKTLSGTGRRQVSGYAGAAENLMENIRRLDSLNSAEHRKAQQEQENAAHYREMLARGTMDDGTVIDAAQRARLEKLLTGAENRAKVYQQSNEAIHQPISGLIEKTDAYGDRVGAAAEADLQRAKQGAGVVGRTLVDAGSALTDVLADAAANVVLPGLGTAGRVARSYGHGAEAAEDKGFDLAQQNLYGGGSAALGELANRMFSSNPILQKAFGSGALDDILLPGLEKSLPGSIVKSAFGEALEEGGENIGDYFLQRAIMGDQADEFSWKDVGYDALIGGLVGGVTGVSRGRGSQNVQNQETDSQESQNRAADAAPAKSSTPTEGNSMGETENVSEGLKTASADTEAKQQPLPSPADRRTSVMETAKKTLGKEGYRMFEEAYRDSDDPATAYSELTRAYNDGLVNRKTGSRALTEGQYESMFEAGRADAAANVAAQSKLAAKETTFNRKDSGIDYSDAMTSEYVKGVDKQTVKVVDTVAKTLGLKVRFADSVDGGSANAQIQSGIITIEKNNPHPLRSIFGHEITHRMQDLAPAEYARLREAVAQSGWTNAAIQMTQDKYAEHGRSIGNEAALDEAVADYVGALLEDSGEMERFIRKYQNDRTLLEKLRDLVRDLARKLKGSGYDANLRNAEKQLSKALDAAAAQVKTNVDVDVNANVGVHVDTKTESASPRDSLKTWNESEYVKARDAAAKELAAALGITQKKAKDYIDSVNSIAKMIAEDQARLDYEASPGRSSFVSNAEYGGSFDFSTLCKKRRLLTGTFTAIQKALPNTALTANEILEIRKMMADQGLEVSCGLCYVEGSRANMGGFTQQFIELYKKYNPGKWYPDMAEMNTPDGIEWVRINHPEVYEQYEYFWNHHGQLRDGDPNLFASQQKPKLYQLHTEYKGEILKHFSKGDSVEQKNENGGVRLQSFSDFEIVHLLDTMQVITDMARVGLAGQAYTKVPDFAWALGDTGLKINLSLIAKGVDEDGKLIFDEREGMAIADAMALRDRYSENVGTIIVAFNDAQLKAAMADDRIDFIIPFHRSQWKKSQYKAMGLPAKTKDYTNQQNEKLIQKTYHEYRGRMVPDKATNYMPNAYWDFSKTGKENAESYLKMCAANNKRPKFYKFLKNNGDGSYSLQPDGSTGGYWKLLIDFKMYDNEGKGAPQNPVRPDFNMEECQRMLDEYAGGHANFPVAHGIVDEFVDKYKKEHPKTRYSLKDKQLQTILDSNPMHDDYHTGIRSVDDIRTFEEALSDDGFESGDDPAPDFSAADVAKALKAGKMTVYSSYPIKEGVFVTPSRMEAQSYAGDQKVHEMSVNLGDVAWIDSLQGQYAPVSKYSLKDSADLAREIARIQKEGRAQKRSDADVQADIQKAVEEAYTGMVDEYGAIDPGERAARDVQVPKKTGKGKKVSQTVRTAMEAAATPDEALPDIEKMVASGDFSYDVYTDKQAIADATSTIEKGWAKALVDWTAAVKKGEVSKKNTAMGWALYNNAVNSGDTKTALTVLDYMVKHQRNAAQALQATRILKKLSPETQLYQIQRSVDSLQEELNKRSGGETVDEATAKRAAGAVGQAKQKAADVAANAHANVKVRRRGNRVTVEGNQAGEPFVFEYAQKVGEALANSLEAKRNRTAKEKTFLQHIVSELNRFASEKLPKEKKGTPLTAIDLLRDYIQNQSFYAEAWEAAQSELRSKYADDPVLGEFINSSIGVDANTNPQNAIFMRALVKAAADSGEGRSVLRRQEALGFTGMADTIADNLIRQTGATDEMADTIRDAAHAYVYDAVSDVRANEKNTNDIKIVDGAIRSAMKDIGVKLADVVTSGTGESAQQAIVTKLVGKYGFGMAEATRTAEIVAERFSHMSKQYAENRLKSMFKERSKTRKTIPDKIELLARLGAFDAGSAYNQLAAERIFKAGTPLAIDEKLAAKFLKAKTQEERDEVMKDIYRDVGRQMPSRFIDKWNAWRYLAMLGNPRTHVRNVLGNAGFAPVVATKNAAATFIEWAVHGVSGGKLNRTKSMMSGAAITNVFNQDKPLIFGNKADRALLKAAWADFAKVQDQIMGNGKYNDAANPNQYIEEGRQVFKFKPLEAARKGNTKAMEAEDMWFSRPHYAAALASYCKAHNLSPEQIAKGKETKNARAYAMKEAQKATYRDTNALSQTISELGRPRADETNPVKKGVGVVMEGILPFRKTPANILARGLEYSPMGLLNGIKQAVWDVKRGNKTGAEAIDSIASGLTGTGLLALGMYLAAQGLIRGHGSDDEDENEFKELMGHQAYALEIGNESYTLDWLAPEALPFFVGVNLWEQTRGSDEEVTLSAMLNAVKTVTEPLLEMSCLQSLNDVFDSVGYATSDGLDGLPAALASAATSYLTQGLPTILGQAERTGEAVRMTTYTEKNAFLTGDMQYTLGKASARIPGVWDYQQIPYIDAWGREESTGATSERAVNNFLNPAYTSEIQTSAMEKELMRLYEKTGESKILPSRAAKYFNVGNQRKDLTADEYVKYAKKKGQNSHSLLTGLTANSTYKSLDSSDQVDAISKCYEYANSVAKAAVSDYEPDGWVAKAISASSTTGIKAEQYVTLYIQQGKIESYKNKVTGDTIDNSKGLLIMQMVYNTPGLTEKQRQQLFLDFGVGKTVRGYNKALVEQKLKIMKAQAK